MIQRTQTMSKRVIRFHNGHDSNEILRRLNQIQQEGFDQNSTITLEFYGTILEEQVAKTIAKVVLHQPIHTIQLDRCGAYQNHHLVRMANAVGQNIINLSISQGYIAVL